MTFDPVNSDRLLERFLQYVQIDSTAVESSGVYPSSAGQLELGRILVGQLQAMGLADVQQSEQGIVLATIPSTTRANASTIALNAHLDTSPETSGKNVKPQVVRDYRGGDLTLPGDPRKVIRADENADLAHCSGHTLVTSDGTTLLGADDKSGVAVIMETAAYLSEHPKIPHGPIKICFTCDEEIGHGVDHVDIGQLGARVCYTLDGHASGEIDVETFSADLAVVSVRGVNIHPLMAKGRMINALRVAAHFLNQLPRDTCSPESTSGREGFLHPYHIDGGVGEATLRILLRDFETGALAPLAERLRAAARESERANPGASVEVRIGAQYRNMADGLRREPRAVALAQQAWLNLGREARLTMVRGGTDGSRFTELGLPTPNLSTGEHNPHSPLEWTSLDEMALAVQMLVELAQLWAVEPPAGGSEPASI